MLNEFHFLQIDAPIYEGNNLLKALGFIDKKNNQEFLKNKDLSSLRIFKETPLHRAISIKNVPLDVIKFLHQMKCDLNAVDGRNQTTLHLMRWIELERDSFDALKIIQYMIENKSDLNLKDENGFTAQEMIKKNTELQDLVNQVHEMKTEEFIDCCIHHPLLIECSKKEFFSFENMKKIIKNKGNVNSRTFSELTPLHILCKKNKINTEAIKYLLEHKAQPNIGENTPLGTPVHVLANQLYNVNSNFKDIVMMMLEKGWKINSNGGYNKNTVLKILCESSAKMDLISFLIDSKADLNIINENNENLLYSVCNSYHADFELIKFFHDNKCDLNIRSKSLNHTPFQLICSRKSPCVIDHHTILYFLQHSVRDFQPIFKIENTNDPNRIVRISNSEIFILS